MGDLSGGEQSIIGEAIRTAIALFNRAKSGQAWDVLFRDETASTLDDENGPAYVAMLRRAREIGRFSKVYFILHQKLLKDLADSKIVVANGGITVL
jgi:DNA repair exonuclease SbcCD ATPase subunit